MIGIGIGIIPRTSVTSVSVVTATIATGIGTTSFTANWNAFSGAQYYLLDVSLSSSFSTFVYQDQVVLAPTTAYVVIGLTENTTYYYRVRASTDVYIDPDYLAFFNRVIAAGGFLTIAEQDSTKQLVADLKANSLWTPMKAIYPMVGASAAACAQNLKSSSFTGTFTSGWTFASTGVTPNGTSAYMETGLIPLTDLSQNNTSASYYIGDDFLNNRDILLTGAAGSYIGSYNTNIMEVAVNDGFSPGLTVTVKRGLFLFSRITSTQSKLYANNLQTFTNTINSSAANIYSIKIGCFSVAGVNSRYANNSIRFSHLGLGLTDTQASDFYTAVQNFNQTLDRQVGAQIVSDPDAQSYINRVYTAGGTLTNLEANAVNKLAIDMKAAGLWTSMKAVYPMIGSSAASCAQNLKSSSFTGSFTAGWTFASTGVKGNTSSTYMNTGITYTASESINFALGAYIRTNDGGNSGAFASISGVEQTVNLSAIFLAGKWRGGGNISFTRIGGREADLSGTANQLAGFFQSSRTANNSLSFRRNTASLGTNSNTVSSVPSTLNIYLGTVNKDGLIQQCIDDEIALAYYSSGLTNTNMDDFYTLVQTFNQTLGRSVGSQIVSDADAQAYVNRVYNAGGSLTNTEANAVNQLVLDMKTAGIWTSMKAVYPMVGSSAAACAQNLKSSSFTGTFTSGWTFASTGATPNGSSAYFDTTLIPNTSLTLTSGHLSFYSRTNNNTGVYDMGTGDGSVQQNLITRYSDDKFYACYGNPGQVLSIANTSSLGFFVTNRNSATNTNSYKNGTQVATGVQTSLLAVQSIYISAFHSSNIYAYSNRQCAFSSIGDGLTDVQATALYNSVQIFQNTLGRAI